MNKAGRWAGRHTETPLTGEGRLQAREAGERAKRLNIDLILSSPQSRAHDTAKIIAETIGYPVDTIELNSLFMERGLGVLEGKPWRPDLNLDGFADIETTDTLLERMHLAYELLLAVPHENVLVVSHGAIGRGLRHVIHPHIPFHRSAPFKNAEIIQLL
jgi:probable phosphoglycerate mutase